MRDPEATTAGTTSGTPGTTSGITADDLVEEVSIDGMCGVY